MTDHHTPAELAAMDELTAAATEMSAYINSLSAEDLVAEARCAFSRLSSNLMDDYGAGHPATVTAIALGECLARFDVDGHIKHDPNDGAPVDVNDPAAAATIGYQPTHTPLPQAVKASEDCRCDSPDGGIRKRVMDLHRITHRLMGDHRPDL